MKFEQLRLPASDPPSGVPAAIVMMLRDIHTDNPKVLTAFRWTSWRLGFPGGQLEPHEYAEPVLGAVRETFEETGLQLNPKNLKELNVSPLRIAAEGKERQFHIFVTTVARDTSARLSEPNKNIPWRFYPVRRLPYMAIQGLVHPVAVQPEVQEIVQNLQRGKRITREYAEWVERDKAIESECKSGQYGFLQYIHDKPSGHLVY
jgi:8-oxo-dGTP pyrophosphatase MutT (NUDIX family)